MPEIGYCGDDCNICPRYLAAKSSSKARLKETAAIWRMLDWGLYDDTLEEFPCRGCGAIEVCNLGVRECAMEKGIDSCGQCADYPCAKLEKVFEKNRLEAITCRQVLSAEDYRLFEKAFFTKKEKLDEINKKAVN